MTLKNLPEGVVDDTMTLSFQEFCELSHSDSGYIIEMVQVGVLEPIGPDLEVWQFTLLQLQRLKKAQRLQKDLKLNLQGVALGLELLDRIKEMQAKIDELEHQLHLLTRLR